MENIKRTIIVIRENLFLIFAFLLICSFPFSESLLSIAVGLIFLQIFFTGNWGYKLNILKSDSSLWALVGIYFIYIVGLVFCRDWNTGVYELQKNIFWLLIPVGVATTKRLSPSVFWKLLYLFVIFVTIATFITAFKIIFQEKFQIVDVRDASFVSHVAFSFQIIFSVFILIFSFLNSTSNIYRINPYLRVLLIIWLLVFLLFQKSLLGVLSLYFTTIFFVIWSFKKLRRVKYKPVLKLIAIVILVLPYIYIAHVYYVFNKELDTKPIENDIYTQNGSVYTFNFENNQKENGHFVYWYICNEELESAWNSRSKLKLDERGSTGYKIYYTLIRYLTSKGLTKDMEGVNALTEKDICNIQNGVSNYIYVDKKYSLYPRIYETIWELSEYRRTGNPNNQSLSQRFEYVKAAIYLIKEKPWGIGTGNYKIEFAKAYEQIKTKLKVEFRFHVHNQYLSYLVKFGFIGLFAILFFIFHSINKKQQFRNILLVVLIITIMISNFGEAVLETHVGLSFFVFFLSLFLWHSPDELTKQND